MPVVPLLLVLMFSADPAAFAKIPDPECAGGTELQTQESGPEITKFCAKRDGTRQGPFVKLGTQKSQQKGSYHNGKLHGAWSRWDEKGTLREQGEYREGKKYGYWATFHANGKQETTVEYGQDWQMRGPFSKWNDQGKKIEEGEYRDGKKHGFWTTYDPATGKVIKTVEFANGVERKR